MKKLSLLLVPTVVLLLSACSENPVQHDDSEEDELSATLELSEDHIHTLEEVTFTASVVDHHGDPFSDLEEVALEYRLAGDADWRSRVMTAAGSAYTYTMMFFTSGDYEVRVMGVHQGHDHSEMMYQLAEPLHVGRAHADVGAFRVEFEAFPGHLHQGETATMRFWIMEATETRPAVEGLVAEIHCSDPSGTEESHDATESSAGVYEADHTFQDAGEAHMAIHFPDGAGELEADFHFPVSHTH